MRCPKCKHGVLRAIVTVVLEVPVLRGGGPDLTGLRVTKERLRSEYQRSMSGGGHCIACSYCGASFAYVKGEGLTTASGDTYKVPKEPASSEEPKTGPTFKLPSKEK
jgi:hypothetical protein